MPRVTLVKMLGNRKKKKRQGKKHTHISVAANSFSPDIHHIMYTLQSYRTCCAMLVSSYHAKANVKGSCHVTIWLRFPSATTQDWARSGSRWIRSTPCSSAPESDNYAEWAACGVVTAAVWTALLLDHRSSQPLLLRSSVFFLFFFLVSFLWAPSACHPWERNKKKNCDGFYLRFCIWFGLI